MHKGTRAAVIGAVWFVGLLGAADAQVVNRLGSDAPQQPATAGQHQAPRSGVRPPVTEYAPLTPPAASVPTVVSPEQDEIAAQLAFLPNETNDEYTARMKVRYEQVKKEADRINAEHAARMRSLVQAWRQ
ncbi:hypothetical protein Q6A26_03900 [Xanthomonas euvesicatoria pv. eucalypti]|uniref:hypothetical protein n=1 Tax=Xanthomonas euvesicatoria TaxID=456327 RepID=UPI0026E2B4D2|nr:hypothetical protein [Xanthomonas euvesicatoria]MDO7931510.1 hypothetical protein [Xanthomonas euvesicatoria pv. eucalypti]MDO7935763.1 hypothetical protein [Xanthomonas euvesicatoria pv. eucalypti]MDO7940037.1 hypothetical protein [Xanthomonas euvesicatoria pv. eucalypti]MDO7944610.1 hypothetical protein [Xanthomonas euvesicatoria pv. eucalypti]MDO7952012.1 hypothetical protein [Xanthomonas euvesicatoria pv. eucalypti]